MDLASSILEYKKNAYTFVKMCENYIDSRCVSDDEIEDMLDLMSNFVHVEMIKVNFLRLANEYKNYKENKLH